MVAHLLITMGAQFASTYNRQLHTDEKQALNTKAVGQLLYGTAELGVDTIGQVIGDEVSAARNQERLKGLTDLIFHIDELPGDLKESLKQSVSEANARFEAGDYEGGGEILGELQANIYSTAGGTGGLVALGVAGGAKLVKAIKSVDNWAKGATGRVGPTVTSAGRPIEFDGQFYSADGFKFSSSYYDRLWTTGGRPAPFLQARSVMDSNPKITPDPRGAPGYFRYEGAGMEMIYNPTTGQIGHIQPLR